MYVYLIRLYFTLQTFDSDPLKAVINSISQVINFFSILIMLFTYKKIIFKRENEVNFTKSAYPFPRQNHLTATAEIQRDTINSILRS